MEKRGLNKYINQGLLGNKFSVDLYFVFKTQNGFKKYAIKPSEDLSKEVINNYLIELEKFVKDASPFKIHSVYDGNIIDNWVLYEDEIAKNITARELFQTSIEEKDKQYYVREYGEYSKIFGVLIVLYTPNFNEIKLFTKQNPFQAVQKQKYFNLSYNDDTFTTIPTDTVYFQRTFDILNLDDKVIIKTLGVYERYFNFKGILAQRAYESFKVLSKNYKFWFPDNAESLFKKLSTKSQKKLISGFDSENPMLKQGNYEGIKRQLKRLTGKEIEMSADGNIKIKTANQFRKLIRVLNLDLGYNSAAKKYILAENRTVLKKNKLKKKTTIIASK